MSWCMEEREAHTPAIRATSAGGTIRIRHALDCRRSALAHLVLGLTLCIASACGKDPTSPWDRHIRPTYLLDLAWDFSPDGRSVLYAHANSLSAPAGIYRTDAIAAGTPQALMTLGPSGEYPTGVRYSPGGDSIAFQRGLEIWIRRISDGTETQVTFTGGNATDPDWDPSGTRLVYIRPFLTSGPDTSAGLFIVDLADLRSHHLTHDGQPTYGAAPRWSPDGGAIAFWYGSPAHLFVVAPDGSGYRDLTPGSARRADEPMWIEGGKRVLYESFGNSGSDHHTRVVGRGGAGDAKFPVRLRPYGVRSAVSRDGAIAAYDSVDASGDTLVLYLKALSPAGMLTVPRPRRLTGS